MTSRQRTDCLEQIRIRVRTHTQTWPILATAAADLDKIAPHMHQACCRMQDARAGLPGAMAYDAPSVSGGKASLTQPERLASQEDRTERDRRLLDQTLTQLDQLTRTNGVVVDAEAWCRNITNRCLTLRRIVESWTPHKPTAKDLRAAGAAAAANEGDWCAHHQTAGYMEPTHRMWEVDGVKTPLCQSCIDQHRRNGRLPSGEWMQRKASKGKADRVKA